MTTTGEVPVKRANELLRIAEDAQLPETLSTAILKEFGPMMLERERLFLEADAITVTDAAQVSEMKKARTVRLALKEIRVAADKSRKKFKDDFLRGGRAIDGIGKAVIDPIAAMEAKLEEQEKFAERLEAKKKAELKSAREAILLPFGFDIGFYDLAEMPEPQFVQLHQSFIALKADNERKVREAEEARLLEEKKRLEEEARIREENARLQREAQAREEAHAAAMRKAEAERKVAEQQAAEAARVAAEEAQLEKARMEAAAAEERRKMAEENRIAAEAARKEREAREKLERDARERAAAEAAKAAAEEKARKAAARAPDKQKIAALAEQISAIPMPTVSSPEAEAVLATISGRIAALVASIREHAKTL